MLETYRDLGNRLGQANVLTNLGIMLRLIGNRSAEIEALKEAGRCAGSEAISRTRSSTRW